MANRLKREGRGTAIRHGIQAAGWVVADMEELAVKRKKEGWTAKRLSAALGFLEDFFLIFSICFFPFL